MANKRRFGKSESRTEWVLSRDFSDAFMRGEQVPAHAWTSFVSVNGQPISPLASNWGRAVEAKLPRPLTEEMRSTLCELVADYYVARVAIISSDSERELKARLAKIFHAAQSLMEAIEIDGQVSVLAWRALEGMEPKTFRRDDFYPLLSGLINRTYRATSSDHPDALQDLPSPPNPNDVWLRFASGLMEIFRLSGGNVTISKLGSEVKEPSKFVQFAWEVMTSLPEEFRQYDTDPWSFSQALSTARRALKK